MTIARGFFKKHPVRTYFALTLAISWSGLLTVGGAGFFAGSRWQTDPRFLPAIQTMLLGPPVAGILSTVLFSGTTGLRDLFVRLIRWRVHSREGIMPLRLSQACVRRTSDAAANIMGNRAAAQACRTSEAACLL